MPVEYLLRFARRLLQGSHSPATGFTPVFNMPEPSPHALQTANAIRETSRDAAIIIHGVMPRSGTNYIAALLRLHPDVYAFPKVVWQQKRIIL